MGVVPQSGHARLYSYGEGELRWVDWHEVVWICERHSAEPARGNHGGPQLKCFICVLRRRASRKKAENKQGQPSSHRPQPTMRMSHDEERGNGVPIRYECDRAPRHWLDPLVRRDMQNFLKPRFHS